MLSASELKARITPQMTMQLMDYLSIEVYQETNEYVIFKSECHSSNSHKLYYYPHTNSFHCFVCGNLDHISLVQQFEGLSFEEAIKWLEDFFQLNKRIGFGRPPKIEYTPREVKPKEINIDEKLPSYNKSILNTFIEHYPIEWLNENISSDVMKQFGIKMDIEDGGKIIIPHYDRFNRLIGIRIRNLDEKIIEEYGKYRPYRDNLSGITYSHKLGNNLYGINLNQENIKKYKTVILVESEKSVMKMQGFYPNDNISLALCGSSISDYQLELLKEINIKNVIYAMDKEKDEKILKKIDKMYKKTSLFFNVYIIKDKNNLLDLKDAPCDKNKEIFEKLLLNKIKYELGL